MSSDETTSSTLEVLPYTLQNLVKLFSNDGLTSEEEVKNKSHLGYFEEYFGSSGLKANTIIVERGYTDRDWLEDYAAFYVRCLDNKYGSRCVRLHFFSEEFDQSGFQKLVLRQDGALSDDVLTQRGSYLGFIVVKPLPHTFVGRTCLATYPQVTGAERCYPIKRTIEAHLAGIDFEIESIAFQEQDRVAAACATSALWSAFDATSSLFHHPKLSPIKITQNATAVVPGINRDVPNAGLSLLQMVDAVRQVELEPEVLAVGNTAVFRAAIRAYLSAGIPIVMMGRLIDRTDVALPVFYNDDPDGGHAVTITGYRRSADLQVALKTKKQTVELEAFKMHELYVHDDQVGPFARMEFKDNSITIHKKAGGIEIAGFDYTLSTSWKDRNGSRGNIYYAPESLLVPVYHKIRLPFEEALVQTLVLARTAEEKRINNSTPFNESLIWDIQLTTIGPLRRHIRMRDQLNGDERLDLLQANWPRFIWQITGRYQGMEVVEVLLDATDIPRGNYVLTPPLVYDHHVEDLLPDDL